MLEIVSKIPFYKIFRRFGYPKIMPMNFTFRITHKCNSKCKTCNIWKIRDYDEELKLREYEKIFYTIGKPFWVTFSGGEPFLRKDFTRIVKKICEICNPKIITIPTNGSLYRTIPKFIKEISSFSSKTKIILNISLDGVVK